MALVVVDLVGGCRSWEPCEANGATIRSTRYAYPGCAVEVEAVFRADDTLHAVTLTIEGAQTWVLEYEFAPGAPGAFVARDRPNVRLRRYDPVACRAHSVGSVLGPCLPPAPPKGMPAAAWDVLTVMHPFLFKLAAFPGLVRT